MMTSTPTESVRKVLGKALRFFREQRHISQRELADRVGCPTRDIDDWEQGKSAPSDHQWKRLCQALPNDFASMRATWQRARAEEERERSLTPGPLTAKPFANLLALVPTPAVPVRRVVAVAPAPPETLHDDGFDLRPAYKAVAKLPEGWRTAEAVANRKASAMNLVKRGLNNDDIHKEIRRKFGVGIGAPGLAELRAEVHKEAADAHRRTREPAPGPAFITIDTRQPEPVTAPEPPPMATTPDNNIEGAVRLILEAIPNLKSFKIEVGDDGEVSVDHTTREVKVVETSGSLKLKK